MNRECARYTKERPLYLFLVLRDLRNISMILEAVEIRYSRLPTLWK